MTALLPGATKECLEFVAAEGRYELQQDIYLDHVLHHPIIPTFVSSVSVKYKDYLNSTGVDSIAGLLDGILVTSHLDPVDEQLRDLKVSDPAGEDYEQSHATSTGASGNFHGNLVDLPMFTEETSDAYKGSRNVGMLSPGPPQVMTPGPPPLKDSTSTHRLSDLLNSSINNTSSQSATSSSLSATKSLGRAASFTYQASSGNLQEEGSIQGAFLTSYATVGPSSASSAGFSSFFSSKRKKPKSNITKTNSTFVAKITTNEHLSRILANRVKEDVYIFWNTGRTFTWSDLGQNSNVGEPLSHISFARAFPTTHDVNILTRSCDYLDVIIGFSTGDIIWFNPFSNKYSRLNKQVTCFPSAFLLYYSEYQATIKDSAVTMIKWIPGSESQFMASFQDGTIVIMDKDRDDSTFSASSPPHENSFHATKPKNGRHNPLSHWNICKKPVSAFAFSPDLQHVAVVAMDGGLRIIDFRHERLIESFQSYFGALNCVCWSPDGKYILTGGQDDLATIWSFKDLRIVARCQGHQSYVTGVAFDSWRCDERNYRFGSVGEDAKLLLWDFSVGALHKPKTTVQRRGSNGTVHGPGGAFRPGHRNKGSITSLRGSGGHSLFSAGQSQSSLSQVVSTHEGDFHESENNPSSVTTASASTLESTRSSLHQHRKISGASSESASISDESLSMLLTAVSEAAENAVLSHSTSGDTIRSTEENSSSFCSDDKVYQQHQQQHKKPTMQQARGLPHLQLHRPKYSTGNEKGSNEHGSHGLAFVSVLNSHTQKNQPQQQQHSQQVAVAQEPVARSPEPRSRVAMLQPLMAVAIHHEPLSSVTFREDLVMTSDRRGHIKVWKRPTVPVHPQP
ncbi:hypothetical protein EDD11_007606 [Mortierella claussenii]|nr:hypothetical protein EDD11_007606 [Mortierella claussenii]